jgi:glycosyltransferase involved in cell wall biosynthesis
VRLHLLALPHTRLDDAYSTCAYTMKVAKLCRMLAGHADVTVYAPEGSSVPDGVELVETVTEAEQAEWFGPWDPARSPDVDWTAHKPWWVAANERSAKGIAERHVDGDVVALTTSSQGPVLDLLPGVLGVEWAVGYEATLNGHRIFESYAWMHHVYGLRNEHDGRWYDAVVPNFFDEAEFPVGDGDGDYLAWLGRWTPRKGPQVAIEIAQAAGLQLLMAGPGFDGSELPAGVEHLGPLDIHQRGAFLASARALLVPTLYIEPFGGVAVEAMLCGTPAITTDWGAFTETVPDCWRFRTLGEAAEILDILDRQLLGHAARRKARDAADRYTLDAVRPQMLTALDRLGGLWGGGWYA